MKKLILSAFLIMVSFTVTADSEYHQVRNALITELSASSPPLAGITAWRDGAVHLKEPHGIESCSSVLKVDNVEHALVDQLRYSLETGEAIRILVEDLLPEVRQSCWVRRVTVGVK